MRKTQNKINPYRLGLIIWTALCVICSMAGVVVSFITGNEIWAAISIALVTVTLVADTIVCF